MQENTHTRRHDAGQPPARDEPVAIDSMTHAGVIEEPTTATAAAAAAVTADRPTAGTTRQSETADDVPIDAAEDTLARDSAHPNAKAFDPETPRRARGAPRALPDDGSSFAIDGDDVRRLIDETKEERTPARSIAGAIVTIDAMNDIDGENAPEEETGSSGWRAPHRVGRRGRVGLKQERGTQRGAMRHRTRSPPPGSAGRL